MNSLHLHSATGSTCLSNAQRLRRSRLRQGFCGQATLYGFTLVELLVVIVVLAVLAGITLPLFRYTMTRINRSKQNIMLNQIKSALEDYRAAYGEYPITPPANANDVRRHYPDSLLTDDAITMNSPFTNVAFNGATTVEQCFSANAVYIDYCLTYPLMIKQLERGANPFMEFPKATMFYMVYRQPSGGWEGAGDIQGTTLSGYLAGGGVGQVQTESSWYRRIRGHSVKRYLAADPISGKQWKYECTNGLNYSLTLNSF